MWDAELRGCSRLKVQSLKMKASAYAEATAARPASAGISYPEESRNLLETSAVNSQTLSAKGTGSDAVPQLGVMIAL